MSAITRYTIATVTPLLLLLSGALVWGGFAVLALIWLTVAAAVLDRVLDRPTLTEEDGTVWADRLSTGLAIGHLVLLPVVTIALTGEGLGFWTAFALFLGTASFIGQVSHPNAHELIHRRPLPLKGLGAAVYASFGFGHHVSAHRLVHHRHVGTESDPNTPLPGESFWAYLPRAWRDSFEAGLDAEIERLERKGLGPTDPRNPFWYWVGGATLSLVTALVVGGLGGALVLIGLAVLGGAQILMSDYVQHYGLQRLILPNGRLEPVGPHHSWNAPRGFSSYLMMNAPAHSEHHMHPDRSFDRLDPAADVPILPQSMPVMAMIAMIPPAWHRLMDRRALKVMEAAQARSRAQRQPTPAPGSIDPGPARITPRRPNAAPITQDVSAAGDPAPMGRPPTSEADGDVELINRVRQMLG